MSHLSRLRASPLAHGGFFPHFHPRRQDPLRTVDRNFVGLHGSVGEALVSHLLHDARGRRRPSGESLFGSSAASQVQEPPVLVWGPIISAISI